MENIPNHFLYPSAIFASRTPYTITTILGSCVSVCLWDPVLQIGGMNHFMLPLWNGQGLASPKYGNIAIPKLIEKLYSFGSQKYNLRAKVFGGAEVIESNSKQFLIGERNAAIAFDILAEEKIQILSSSIGGNAGRKIIFFTENGEVKHKFIQKTIMGTNE